MEDYTSTDLPKKPPVSHRFSMFERWQDKGPHSYVLGNNLRSLCRRSIELVIVDPQFDPERYYQHNIMDRPARDEKNPSYVFEKFREPSLSEQSDTISPLEERSEMTQNPFDDSNSQKTQQNVDSKEPYHIFTKVQKWPVVIMIGVAGLFSGLSSNIYNPALNSIAQVHSFELSTQMATMPDTI